MWLCCHYINISKTQAMKSTLDNDLQSVENFVLSLGEINAIEQPSAEARAVLPLLCI